MDEKERLPEETIDTPPEVEKNTDRFGQRFGTSLLGLMYGGLLVLAYWGVTQLLPWFIPFSVFFPTLALILVAAIGLYLYSDKGAKYIFAWPAISFITCILLAVFEKLAS